MKNIDIFCCDTFKNNLDKYGWYLLEDFTRLIPHIKGTNLRINCCPTCGKECRDIEISSNMFTELINKNK